MQHHTSVGESAQPSQPFPFPSFAIVWSLPCWKLTSRAQLFPRGSSGTLGLPGVRRKTQVREMEGGGWKSPPPPRLCLWSRVRPRVQLEWSLISPFQLQLKVWALWCLTEMTQVLDADLPSWSWLGGTLIYCPYEPQVTPFALSPGRRARWQSVIGHDHCSALGEWHRRVTSLLSPSQNVCAGAAINAAVLTRRCNPRRLSLGLIYITLSGARERDAPREGRRLLEGLASSLLSWHGEGTAGRAG